MTKAAARRWFEARSGEEVDTVQWGPSGITWEPGPRTVAVEGRTIRLDDSRVEFTRNHVVLDVADDRVRIEWQDDDGTTIHVTTYRDVDDADEYETDDDDADEYETDD